MILNVVKEGELTSYNIDKSNKKVENSSVNNVQIKRIKELLDETKLKYVSSNVRNLLGLTNPNDPECFSKKQNLSRRVVQIDEYFRVILYIRLSQEDGDLVNGDVSGSIKNQLLYLLDECSKRKNWIVVGIFCEEDISGVDDNRPEWLKSIRFAEAGNTEIVLCKSQSRFTRSMEMVEKYLHKCFPEWNVRFLGLIDNSDTNNDENKKSRQINGLVNEWYVEDVSKNTRDTLNSMKRNGQFTGSWAPYGYLIDPKDKHHLISDLYARQAVRIMAGMLKHGKGMPMVIEVLMRKKFLTPADYKTSMGIKVNRGHNQIKNIRYMVEDGDTLKSIANKFYVTIQEIKSMNNMIGKKVKQGDILVVPYKQRWTSSMIRKIVTDETQIGTLVQGKTERTSFKNKKPIYKPKEEWIRVPHCHSANLDLDTFNIMVDMFGQDDKKSRSRFQKNGELPLFSKKVYCIHCGKPLHKNKSRNKEYLYCRGHNKSQGCICDNKDTIDLNEFKEYILKNIREKINTYYDLSKISEEYYLQNIYSNIDADIEVLKKEKLRIEADIEIKNNILVSLYTEKATGILTNDEFMIIKSSNSLEIENLKSRLVEIDTQIINLNLDKEKQLEKEKLFEEYKNISDLNRVVLDAFISRIEVGKIDDETATRPINIEWNLYTT